MKFGLFFALLVLLAATNVYGQEDRKSSRRKDRPDGEDTKDVADHRRTEDRVRDDDKSGDRIRPKTKSENRDRDDGKVLGDLKDKIQEDLNIETPAGLEKNRDRDSSKKEWRGPSTRDPERNRVEGELVTDKPSRHRDEMEGDDEEKRVPVAGEIVDGGKGRRPIVKVDQKLELANAQRASDRTVHVRGNIVLVKYRSSVIDAAQYDLDGSLDLNNGQSSARPTSLYARDYLGRGSRVTLYVATSKTTNPKFAFAKFPIMSRTDNFPLAFDIGIELPDKQRGLLERADITLYFFVYITSLETRLDTFLPAGTSQILLQGTNRNAQPLDVFVRANGIEVNGLFRGRFGQRYIESGTVFQVLVVDEKTLSQKSISTADSVAQVTISNVPSVFPVPFSLLVRYQMMKPNTKYYAVAYIFENGVRRLISREPVWVISEQKVLVAPQLVFTIIPSPFILKGLVTRSMPGSFFVQPQSTILLRLHEIGSDEGDIIFKIPNIVTLPQVFQVNVSESSRFDPSKNYDIRAVITDKNNDIYMTSLQPVALLDESGKVIVPVDDYLHYVQVRLHSSNNHPLRYIPGSTAQIFVTETPETPSKPLVSMSIDKINSDFRDFTLQLPTTRIQRNRNYYLVMMIEKEGIITHVSKTLLISNNQPPPLVIQLPVLSLNIIRGAIYDSEDRRAQWSSSAYAKLYLLDDKIENPEKAIVQVWKIHLENDFPIRFEVQLDFSRLRPGRAYRLQSAIENARNLLEYKPASSPMAINPKNGILNDVRVLVHNVKTSQTVKGRVQLNDVQGPLPETSEIIVQLSSTPSLTNPKIIDELRLKVDGRTSPIDFTMVLPLTKIDVNEVYYFLVRYIVRDNVVIPASQAFAFSPRTEATIVLTLSKSPQIPITGQVTSTGSPLILPADSALHLYITDNVNEVKPTIFSEVFLQATPNSLYDFTMTLDAILLQKKIPLYLRADILYKDRVILSIPRPALLQITPGGEWNINLIINLPTLVIGEINTINTQGKVHGEFDVFVQVLERGTTRIVHTTRLRLDANLPQGFRIELDNELFERYPNLEIRALIKNCKEETLYASGGSANIRPGLNLNVKLPVILSDSKKLDELRPTVNEAASLYTGSWSLSINGVVNYAKNGETSYSTLRK